MYLQLDLEQVGYLSANMCECVYIFSSTAVSLLLCAVKKEEQQFAITITSSFTYKHTTTTASTACAQKGKRERESSPSYYDLPILRSTRGPSSSYSARVIQNSGLSFIMSASTDPPRNTMCLRRGGSSMLILNFFMRSVLPVYACIHRQRVRASINNTVQALTLEHLLEVAVLDVLLQPGGQAGVHRRATCSAPPGELAHRAGKTKVR